MRSSPSRHLFALSLSIIALGGFTPTTVSAANSWPGLRGPSYDGAVHDAQLFDGDTVELIVGWKRTLGAGYSVVTVDGERLVTAFQVDDKDVVAAFDPDTGEERWRYTIGEAHKGHTGSHDGPIATPSLVDGRVYGLGPWGHLFALDANTGGELWARHLVEDLEAEAPYYGFASSPLLAEGVLVVEIGAGEAKTIGGFDPDNGELIWSAGTDSIRYHSPIVATIAGHRQVVAVGNKTVMGLDPRSGAALWTYDHEGDERDMGGNTIVPVPAGENRILLMNTHPTSVMLQITKGEVDEYQIAELWSAGSIKSSYVQPVYHEGHLYGMNSKIFTCVDAATGETVWRAREPGDGFPTVVGDHLVIMNKPGTLIVAEASPQGYHEIARLDLFADRSWSAPAYVNGRLYVRSMGELARVNLADGAGEDTAVASWITDTEFGRFLADVEHASDKSAVIDAFLEQQGSFPIIENSNIVHFVFRGEANDVGIVGDMIGNRREDPMIQVADTDLFHYSTRLEPDAAVTYGFIVDFADPVADPRNPNPGEGLFGEVSWLTMPAWVAPDILGEAAAERQGRLETVEWESRVREEAQTRTAQVYLPVGYDPDSDRRYPTVYVHRGDSALEEGKMKNTLDHLIGQTVEPLIAVFVIPVGEDPFDDLGDRPTYSEIVATELVPLIDQRYRTIDDPAARASIGTAGGGDAALFNAFHSSETFGRAGSVATILFDDLEDEIPRADEHPLVVYQTWGTYHIRSPHEAWNAVVENRELWQALRDNGYRPAGGEAPVGFGWVCWHKQTGEMLETLFPVH